MREHMPENQLAKPHEPQKDMCQDAVGCLGEKTSCLNFLETAYYRSSLRVASQNKIDDDGEWQKKIKKGQRRM